MRISTLAISALTLAVSLGAAEAATVYATSVADVELGTGNRGNSVGYDTGNTAGGASSVVAEDDALGAADGFFFSAGIGGLIVLDFAGAPAGDSVATVFEVSFLCNGVAVGGGCANFPETAAIYAGSNWVAGAGLAGNSQFQLVANVSNDVARNGQVTALIAGGFTQLAILDTSDAIANPIIASVNAGFDIDAVGVSEVPVPATLPLLAAGFGLLGLRRRA